MWLIKSSLLRVAMILGEGDSMSIQVVRDVVYRQHSPSLYHTGVSAESVIMLLLSDYQIPVT